MAYKIAQYETLAAAPGGLSVHVKPFEAWDENDPLVKNNPDLFADEPPYVRTSEGRVERATAAPGEKRRR